MRRVVTFSLPQLTPCYNAFTFNLNIYKIQRLQDFAARVVIGNFDYVNSRGVDIVKSFKFLIGLAPSYQSYDFVLYRDTERAYDLRSSVDNNVMVPCVNASVMKCSFSHNDAILQNNLPDNLKAFNDVCDFKRSLKDFIFTSF